MFAIEEAYRVCPQERGNEKIESMKRSTRRDGSVEDRYLRAPTCAILRGNSAMENITKQSLPKISLALHPNGILPRASELQCRSPSEHMQLTM